MKVTLGFVQNKLLPMELEAVKLRPWNGIFLPPKDYFTAHPLPDEWMKIIPRLSGQLPLESIQQIENEKPVPLKTGRPQSARLRPQSARPRPPSFRPLSARARLSARRPPSLLKTSLLRPTPQSTPRSTFTGPLTARSVMEKIKSSKPPVVEKVKKKKRKIRHSLPCTPKISHNPEDLVWCLTLEVEFAIDY